MKNVDIKYTEAELKKQYTLYQKSFSFLNAEFHKILTPDELAIWEFIVQEFEKLSIRLQTQCQDMPPDLAEVIAWVAFEEAIDSDPEQLCPIFTRAVETWWHHIPAHRAPLYHESVNVAFDIARGFSEQEAKSFHHEWLQEDEENRIYENYYYAEKGIIVNLSDNREMPQA